MTTTLLPVSTVSVKPKFFGSAVADVSFRRGLGDAAGVGSSPAVHMLTSRGRLL
jgi:hypothetical protein